MNICYNHMFIYGEYEIINMFFKERRSKYKPAYALDTHSFQNCSCLYRDFNLVMEMWFKVMEKSWKSTLVKMCKNPAFDAYMSACFAFYLRMENAEGYVLIAVYLFIYLYACSSHNKKY